MAGGVKTAPLKGLTVKGGAFPLFYFTSQAQAALFTTLSLTLTP